jgi:hypothetical protein
MAASFLQVEGAGASCDALYFGIGASSRNTMSRSSNAICQYRWPIDLGQCALSV